MVTRSLNGCWTCRLRRKKCDEQQPSCHTCETRHLRCYGYGPRPDWMDRGEKERKAAERLAREIKLGAERKRAPSTMAVAVMSPGATFFLESSMPENQVDSRSKFQESQQPSAFAGHSAGPHKLYATQAQMLPELIFADETQTNTHSAQESEQLANEGLPISMQQHQDLSSIQNTNQEATLLMYYLDNVFRTAQFPYYDQSTSASGRGWLFLLLTQTKPVYHAALSLSAYHLYSNLTMESAERRIWYDEIGRHQVLALKHLQDCIKKSVESDKGAKLQNAVEALACIAQLICFEHYHGGMENWPLHLQAASSLVPILTDYLQELRSSTQVVQLGSQIMAVKVLVIVFLRHDCLSCISTGSEPIFGHCYQSLLQGENQCIQMEEFIGCKNWVTVLILNIAILDDWKRRSRTRGDLSIRELAIRAGRIERHLECEIGQNLVSMGRLAQSSTFQGNVTQEGDPKYIASKVTHVFGCAALIYLHVIVSGWNPEVSEIRESVRRSTLAFRDLPDIKLLSSLAWPFCITGCLARKNEEKLFRNMVMDADINELSMGNLWNAFQIMERCWSKRDEMVNGQRSSEWKDVMGILGTNVLLT